MLLAKEIVTGGDDIAQEETSFQSTNLPAHYGHLGSPLPAASPQPQQFIDPYLLMNPLQHVQDPSGWDFQFPPLLEFDAMLPLGFESPEESNNTQFSDGPSSPNADQYDGSRTDSLSDTLTLWVFRSEDYPSHSNSSSIANDQIEQAAPEWHRLRGCPQGVGVTSSAMDNYEHGSDSSISYNLGRDMREVYCRPFIPLCLSNQIITNRRGYETSSSLSTTTPTSQTLCARCYREWKYCGLHWYTLYSVVCTFIRFWAWLVACRMRLLRSVYVGTVSCATL